MKVIQCNLENYRNIESAHLRFDGASSFLLGMNAQGKSNLLEAVGLLQAVRSFRTHESKSLIRYEQAESRIFYQVEDEDGEVDEILLSLKKNGENSIWINGEKCAGLGSFLGRYPVQVLASDDIQILRGAPSLRRRLLDLHLATTDKDYYQLLRDYHRALAQRNKLLKKQSDPQLLRAYDAPLARTAAALVQIRKTATRRLSETFFSLYHSISGEEEEPGWSYNSQLLNMTEDEIREKWADGRERDRLLGSTQFGPHRDDWLFSLKGSKAQNHASEGQQRNIVLAMKLSLYHDLTNILQRKPVLLTDDVLGELDDCRRMTFWDILPKEAQVIATGTRPLENKGNRPWKIFRVAMGEFVQEDSRL